MLSMQKMSPTFCKDNCGYYLTKLLHIDRPMQKHGTVLFISPNEISNSPCQVSLEMVFLLPDV